jgi:fatty acid desaturase
MREEVAIARRQTPDVAWPTLALILGLWLAFAGASALALAGAVPMAVAAVVNTIVLYAIYTPLHDAIHSAVVARRPRWRWVNAVVGMAAAAPIFMIFQHHRKSHFVHHARTNTAEDSDLYAKGSFLEVFFLKVPWALVNYFNPVALYRDCVRLGLAPRDLRITMALFGGYVAVLAAIVAAGWGRELVVLWLVPWFVGNLVMLVMFGWAPHHDHSETGRYRNTRAALFPGAEWLTLGQNLHLVHHMLPSVPFYRYRATFDELRPILERHDARIEGFWPYTAPPARAMA